MNDIQELQRLPSPAPTPLSLAWDGSTSLDGLSRQTGRIYGIDPATWTVTWETAAPGTPFGMTAVGKELRVLCGETVDDNRIIRRCIPGKGFDATFGIPCPDDTGSQLSYDGQRLLVSQWYARKVLALGAEGKVERVIDVPHEISRWTGFCYRRLYFRWSPPTMRIRPITGSPAWTLRPLRRRKIDDLARHSTWWPGPAFETAARDFRTNHREQNQIVSFARPT